MKGKHGSQKQVTIATEAGALFVLTLRQVRDLGKPVPQVEQEIGRFAGGLVVLEGLGSKPHYVVNFLAFEHPPESLPKLTLMPARREWLPNYRIVIVDDLGDAYLVRRNALQQYCWTYDPDHPLKPENMGYALTEYQIVQGVENSAISGRPAMSLMYPGSGTESSSYAGIVLNCASFRTPS